MKYFITFFFFVSLALNAHAQISIDFPDFIAVLHDQNSVQKFVVPFTAQNPSALSSLIGKGDTNMTWDFRIASYSRRSEFGTDSAMVYPSGAVLANDPEFISTNEVVRNFAPNAPTKYSFFEFTDKGIFDLGITQDSSGVATKVIGWNPPVYEAAIPMRFGTTWQSTSKLSGTGLQSGESRTVMIKDTVDAWGNIQLPQTPYQLSALRVKKQIIVFDSIEGASFNTDTSYQYFFCGNNMFSATITTDSRNVIISAEYAAPFFSTGVNQESADDSRFFLRQNPATDAGTNIGYSLKYDGQVRIEVMDELGRSLRMLQNERVTAGRHSIAIDPGMLGSGAYFIRLVSPEMTAMKKLIITR